MAHEIGATGHRGSAVSKRALKTCPRETQRGKWHSSLANHASVIAAIVCFAFLGMTEYAEPVGGSRSRRDTV